LSLANPVSTGIPAKLSGDFGFYSAFEQKIYRTGNDDDRGVGVFARAAYSPPGGSLIDFYADTGVEFIGLSDRRPNDKFGLAGAYAHVSPRAQALDRNFRALNGADWPLRSSEALLTAVYQYEVRAGLTLQPTSSSSGTPAAAQPTLWARRTVSISKMRRCSACEPL